MPQEYPHIPDVNEYRVYDWRSQFGVLVRYSDHWHKERCCMRRDTALGIVVDIKFFQDGRGRIVPWPIVMWERQVCSSMCHPVNVTPARRNHGMHMITIGDGQWGTHGPPTENQQCQVESESASKESGSLFAAFTRKVRGTFAAALAYATRRPRSAATTSWKR